MKQLALTITLLVLTVNSFSQKNVDISDKYYGMVYVESPDEVFSPGWITINSVKTGKQLIRVESEELAVDYNDNGDVKINVKQLPYGEQSVIIYEDFNFDGIKDFAIEDGQNSCYHGPSFQIYLADGKGGFIHNSDFTDLAQSYCGMFNVDPENKRIYTMTKSGCCWHQFNEFEVVKNKPIALKIREEGFVTNGCFVETSISEKVNGIMDTKVSYMLSEDTEEVFSFKIAKNGKKVLLFRCGEDLRYTFLTAEDGIEFAYPAISDIGNNETYDFELRRNSLKPEMETLDFTNKGAKYHIYNEIDKVGIRVTVKGKIYDMKGDLTTRKGSISKAYFDSSKEINNVNFVDDN